MGHFPILLFFFSLQPPKSPLQAAGTSFEKLVRKLRISPSFLVLEPDLEPRILPPLAGNPDLLCSSFLTAGCSCFVGVNCFEFSVRTATNPSVLA
ncbi:hypothetical protein SLEP1_g55959 [Rubroshorea leprosula]|uniref:Secreted protein n=1 Tax=Rubroshorea leprosula TaxID=152421 RepID=A0AAV5MK92_9ROSI|nr:hypothetical protein SLEP1_g55959 [Rubroshorea leprosula]